MQESRCKRFTYLVLAVFAALLFGQARSYAAGQIVSNVFVPLQGAVQLDGQEITLAGYAHVLTKVSVTPEGNTSLDLYVNLPANISASDETGASHYVVHGAASLVGIIDPEIQPSAGGIINPEILVSEFGIIDPDIKPSFSLLNTGSNSSEPIGFRLVLDLVFDELTGKLTAGDVYVVGGTIVVPPPS